MKFADEFSAWVSRSLEEGVPGDVRAFCFNLYDRDEDGLFGVELVGTDEFDPDDEDWASAEAWVPENPRLDIPLDFSGDDWERCLDNLGELVSELLESGSAAAGVLKSGEAVAVGFVDGDLEVVWQASE